MLTHPPIENHIIAENIPLNIVYEDDALLMINKEPGMVVHQDTEIIQGTLVHALAYHLTTYQ
jgi:23S rRNA pseudouridine1911/1915/1917 synthase